MNLDQLKKVAAPLAPPYELEIWPPPLGFWLLAAGILAGLFFWLSWRQYRSKRTRRYAYRKLESIQKRYVEQGDPQRYVYELNLLLRRLAVRNFRREKVASLTGDEWLAFLDWSAGRPQESEFCQGSGRILAWGAYQAAPEQFDAESLAQLVKAWIQRQT